MQAYTNERRINVWAKVIKDHQYTCAYIQLEIQLTMLFSSRYFLLCLLSRRYFVDAWKFLLHFFIAFFISFSPVCRSSLFWPFYTLFFSSSSILSAHTRAYMLIVCVCVCRCVSTNRNLCADFAVHLRLRKESFKKEITNEPTNRRRCAGSLPRNRLHNVNDTKRLSSIVSLFFFVVSIDMEKKNSIS